jgi:hypothetical protein
MLLTRVAFGVENLWRASVTVWIGFGLLIGCRKQPQ